MAVLKPGLPQEPQKKIRAYRGFRGLGFRGLGFRGLGFRGLGLRVSGV